ncbi:diphthine--ammonia ligase [Halobacillus massiliensis]|uniref:Dph6-related ATP pyrophosphatase n=1 Tax=Halobacillus massiliensis TaxID=1926286 RepID=UPI0009E468D7|nr:diphthine--ammonia ligase [Halobacillus massiliensis]
MIPLISSWSGGKDSAYALYKCMQDNQYHVKGLFSTTSSRTGKLPIHEVDREMIYQQAQSIGLPLNEAVIEEQADNSTYERVMNQKFKRFKASGIFTIAYADLYLEDIKAYRDDLLKKTGMNGYYPLWKLDTKTTASKFIEAGFKAVITTVDTEKLPADKAGQLFSKSFVDTLPSGIDPCGENGEFHTFVYDGPIFQYPVLYNTGRRFKTLNGRFAHIEILPNGNANSY